MIINQHNFPLVVITARYWRIFATNINGHPQYTSLDEFQLMDGTGMNRIETSGKTYLQSNTLGGIYDTPFLFNGTWGAGNANYWAANGITNQWAGVDMGSPVAVGAIRVGHNQNNSSEAPKDFLLQSSDNGSTWTTRVSATRTVWSGSVLYTHTF